MPKLVVLFDDERNFLDGFRDGAIVIRSVEYARIFFEEMKETGFIIDELWLDFVLAVGTTAEVIGELPGEQIRSIYYHSSASSGKELIEHILRKDAGYTGTVQIPTENVFK